MRAIADMVYLNKKISWKTHGIDYLTESLRIVMDLLKPKKRDETHYGYKNHTEVGSKSKLIKK